MSRQLDDFVTEVNAALSDGLSEAELFAALQPPFAALIKDDTWLPEAFAQPHPVHYQQYLLYLDPEERFSVVSFVWGPGQKTPIHNHTVWGLVGVLRGGEIGTRYALPVEGTVMRAEGEEYLHPGMIDLVSPEIGDIHAVRNAFDDKVSISIHVYGANIGKVSRAVYDPQTSVEKIFVSGFTNV